MFPQVATCNGVGVRIYVDAVINHMSGQGAGEGTAGSKYDTLGRSYEGVPFNSSDFNGKPKCPTYSGDIEDYHNAIQVNTILQFDISKELCAVHKW